jgi:hypothetical protein
MLGVLEVILRQDPVPGQSFGASQGQIAFIVSLGVLSVPRLGAGEPGRVISPVGLGFSRHGVGHHFRIGRGCAAAGSSLEMYFIVSPYAAQAEARGGRSRNCRVGRRGEGSNQALIGAESWARHSIENAESWPSGSRSTLFT